MAKDSNYHKDLNEKRKNKILELKKQLPKYTYRYLDEMMSETGFELSTIIAYARDLITFFEYIRDLNPNFKDMSIKDIPLDVLDSFTHDDISEYKSYLANNNGEHKHSNQLSSINRRMAPLRGLYADLLSDDSIKNNPTISKTRHKRKNLHRNEVVFLETDEVKSLESCVENSEIGSDKQKKFCEKTKLRDLAIITLMLNTGIRVSECAGVDLKDINFEKNSIYIFRKGGFETTLYFNDRVRDILLDYIENERPKYIEDEKEEALFLSSKKQRMAVRSIQAMIKKFASSSITTKKISAHKLRSSYATALYEETNDINICANILGHVKTETTLRYVNTKERQRQSAGSLDIWNK